ISPAAATPTPIMRRLGRSQKKRHGLFSESSVARMLYDDRPCRVALEGLAERTERDDFVVGHLARRLLRARARGDSTGRKRGAKVNWPSVCLSPAGSHGNGLSCVPHANTGVLKNMSDVSVQATVSFIIPFRKRTS